MDGNIPQPHASSPPHYSREVGWVGEISPLTSREMEGGETVMRNFTQNEVHGSETAPVATRLAENSIFIGLGKHTC